MSPSWTHDANHDGKASSHQDYDDAEKGLCETVTVLPPPMRPPPPTANVAQRLLMKRGTMHRLDTQFLTPASPIREGITPSPSLPELSLHPELSLPWPAAWQEANIGKVPETAVAKFESPSGHEEKDQAGKDTESDRPGSKQRNGPPAAEKKKPFKPGFWILFNLWFNTYRKFFTFVTTFNLTGIILAAVGKFPYAENHLGAIVLGNLLTAILMRNELFLRFLYIIAIYGLRSWAPLWIKIGVTSVLQHVGGIHSGCALSGAAWLVYKVVDIIIHKAAQPDAVLATGILTNALVIISVLSAFPWVRNNYHNTFERHHRFVGWLGLASTWVFVILGNSYDIKLGEWRADANTLLSNQEFWFAVFMTVFVLIPWFTLREVPVEVEIPSPKVAVIKFQRGMQQGLLGRISRTSIMEYHAFGTISEGTKSDCHYMICGVQGDFTKDLVANPPKTLWTRELKFAGVGHASAMYKRGIRICTGTGIGAALSTCIQSKNWFLIWIGSDQERTFGPVITGLIYKHIEPERMILWDSKKRGGRPDTVQLLTDTWHSFGAEVIFITSNMQGNDEMMRGCRAAGLHAFGTLWDF